MVFVKNGEIYTTINQCKDQLENIYKEVKKLRIKLKCLNRKTANDMDFFYELRYKKIFRDPFSKKGNNFGEILDQLYTYIVTFRAIEYLIGKEGVHDGYIVNIGTEDGADIYSVDGKIYAEVFTSVQITNNSKINKDLTKVLYESIKPKLKEYITYNEWKKEEGNEDKESSHYYKEKIQPLIEAYFDILINSNRKNADDIKRYVFFYSDSLKENFNEKYPEYFPYEKSHKLFKSNLYNDQYEKLLPTVDKILVKV